jgi:hypothetical protein
VAVHRLRPRPCSYCWKQSMAMTVANRGGSAAICKQISTISFCRRLANSLHFLREFLRMNLPHIQSNLQKLCKSTSNHIQDVSEIEEGHCSDRQTASALSYTYAWDPAPTPDYTKLELTISMHERDRKLDPSSHRDDASMRPGHHGAPVITARL